MVEIWHRIPRVSFLSKFPASFSILVSRISAKRKMENGKWKILQRAPNVSTRLRYSGTGTGTGTGTRTRKSIGTNGIIPRHPVKAATRKSLAIGEFYFLFHSRRLLIVTKLVRDLRGGK